jgi:hypothetical protein
MSKKHTHYLTPGLVSILKKVYAAVKEKDRNCIHLQKDLDLDHNEYANAQKLRYFALMVQVEGKSGYWLITAQGGRFLRCEGTAKWYIKTQDNQIIERSPETRMITDYYSSGYDKKWFQEHFFSTRIDDRQPLLI